MKIIIVVILLASISFNSFGQQNPKPGTKEFFVQKSEKQKRTGTTFLTLGLTSAGLGAVIAAMG